MTAYVEIKYHKKIDIDNGMLAKAEKILVL